LALAPILKTHTQDHAPRPRAATRRFGQVARKKLA
jgi:hypothetical protein